MLKPQRLTTVILLVAAILLGACQTAPSIVGKWSGKFQNQNVSMEFTDKGTCTITSNGQTVDCTYTLDTSIKPFKLDLAVKDAGTVQTIVDFTDSKTMKMENSDVGKPRPTAIDDQSATFTKQ